MNKNQDKDAIYILCYPDFEWQYDPLREDPKKRIILYQKYLQDLRNEYYKFIIAKGSNEARTNYVINHLNLMH